MKNTHTFVQSSFIFREFNKGSRNFVVCQAKRSGFAGTVPSKLTGTDCYALFHQLTLTTPHSSDIEILKQNGNLTTKTMTKKFSRLGSGMTMYEGSEWFNGDIFVGKNKENRGLLKVSGTSGLDFIQNLAANSASVNILKSCTITQMKCLVTIPANSFLNTEEKWRSEVGKCLDSASGSTKSIYLEQSSFCMGRRGATRLLSLKPFQIEGKGKEFTKLLIELNVNSQPAMHLLNGFLMKPANPKNLIAFMVKETLEEAKLNNDYMNHIIGALSQTYDTANVIIEDIQTSSNKLAPVIGACTLLLNKAVVKSSTKDVFSELKESFFDKLMQRRDECDNYLEVMKALRDHLNKQIQEAEKH